MHLGRSDTPPAAVTLAELQALRVPLEWYDALAIVQSICASVLDGGEDVGPANLDPSDVTIAPDGVVSVAVTGRRESAAAVRSVAEILHEILPEAVPAPLRLAVSQAFFTPPAFATLQAFSQALEFFERPNRIELVRAIHARCMIARAEAVQNPALHQPSRKPAAKPKRRPRISIPRPNPLYVRRAAIVVLGFGAGTLAAFGAYRMVKSETSVVGAGAEAVSAASSKVEAAVDNVVGRLLGVRHSAPDVVDAPEATPAASAPKPPAGKRQDRKPTLKVPVAEPTALFGLGAPAPPDVLPASLAPDAAAEHRAGLAARDPLYAASTEPSIYSEGDQGITPPSAIYPRLPTALPAGVAPASVAVIDAVIDEAGLVESVRIRRSPTTMSEAMVVTMTLSATKTWRFHPGTKDGVPIRYRQAIWVSTH